MSFFLSTAVFLPQTAHSIQYECLFFSPIFLPDAYQCRWPIPLCCRTRNSHESKPGGDASGWASEWVGGRVFTLFSLSSLYSLYSLSHFSPHFSLTSLSFLFSLLSHFSHFLSLLCAPTYHAHDPFPSVRPLLDDAQVHPTELRGQRIVPRLHL